MSDYPEYSRSRLLRVLSIVWIALISGLVFVDRVSVSHLTQRVEQNIDHLVVQTIEEKVAALEQHVQALQRQPSPVSQETFTAVRQAFDERLSPIEQRLKDVAGADDLRPLEDRLSAIETRLARARTKDTTTTTHGKASAQTPPAPPDPPFTVLGVERRAGTFFLSVAPAGAYSLDSVRVLQAGEAYEDWQLESIDAEVAVFRINGRSQRVTVP